MRRWQPAEAALVTGPGTAVFERPGPPTRLHDDRGAAEGRDNSVSLQEPPASGRGAWRKFADHDSPLGDLLKQHIVACGVEPVHTSGQNGDCVAVRGEGC